MISTILLMSALGGAPHPTPQIQDQDTDNKTVSRYAEIANRFAAASEPTIPQVTGWHSGRCYKANGDTTLNGLLVVTSRPSHDGPLFDPHTKVIMIESHSEAPDYFDNISSTTRSNVNAIINSSFDSISDAEARHGSLISEYPDNIAIYQVRRDNHYIYAAFANRNTSVVIEYCYYFVNVTP